MAKGFQLNKFAKDSGWVSEKPSSWRSAGLLWATRKEDGKM
jgi:hypothetical protein